MMPGEEKPALLTIAEWRALNDAHSDLMMWIHKHQDTINNLLDSETRGFLMGAALELEPDAVEHRRRQRRAATRKAAKAAIVPMT